MNTKKKRITVVSLLVLIPILIILYFVVFSSFDSQNKIERENANTFVKKINMLVDSQEYPFSDVVPFEWDHMYVFPEYTDVAYIEKAIGLKNSRFHMSDSEGMQQIIFVNKNKMVGYIQGMDYKLGFSIVRNGQDYLEVENDNKSKLHVNIKDGLKYLEFKPMVQ